jgi:bacterioferritin (cytochrome b1)
MVLTATMPAAPVAVVDVLNGLLEGEMASIFRFLEQGTPYLSRTTAEIRQPLHEIVETTHRHIGELHGLILDLGGVPIPSALHPEEQFLAFLSLKFLLPKLVEAKRFVIQRYENALKAIRGAAAPQVIALLEQHLDTHRRQLQVLEQAAERVAVKDGQKD